MAKFKLRKQARALRVKRGSIRTISKTLGVSKSTVSVWCNDIELTPEQKKCLIENALESGVKGRFSGAEANKKKKIESLRLCKEWSKMMLREVNQRDLFIAGIALYWGEGSKKGTKAFNFVNSDPVMILFMYTWLRRIMKIKPAEILPRISINEIHRPRISTVLRFWADLLSLPVAQFGNPWYIHAKVTKVYENYDSYHGILRLGVRNGTMLKYKMLSLIELFPRLVKKCKPE